MADLTFPQLSSGALVQYPIRKGKGLRTIKNILADGTMLVAADPGGGKLVWNLSYIDLSTEDLRALQSHFANCAGPLRGFTFLDPADNLLAYSADLTAPSWNVPPGVTMITGMPDPFGGNAAFLVTNGAAAAQQLVQTVAAPVSYQYCFSVYAFMTNAGSVSLARSSGNDLQTETFALGAAWARIISSGRLNDTGTGLSAAITVGAGQSVLLFGPQLEPQSAPSRFRPTYSRAGIYPSAHWAVQELIITAEAPNLFSTSFAIETTIPD
jgi:hypothetical protein